MSTISALVLTKDSEKTIRNTLESLKNFKEVVVLDTGSKDQTKEIIASLPNTKLYEHSFPNIIDT